MSSNLKQRIQKEPRGIQMGRTLKESIHTSIQKISEWGRRYGVLVGFCFLALLLIEIYSRVLLNEPDGVYATHPYVWSDWSLHLAMTNLFAHQLPSEWFRHHPVWSGGAFTYPFLCNFIPAILMWVGVPLTWAMNGTAVVFSLFLLFGIYRLGRTLGLKAGSVFLATLLFFFSSGHRGLPVYWDWAQAVFHGEGLSFLEKLPNDPTRIESFSWLAGNVFEATLLPQRAMLFGMMLGVWALAYFFEGCAAEGKNSRFPGFNGKWFISGLLIGFLPISHMHTLISLVPVFLVAFISFFLSQRGRFLNLVKNYLPGAILCVGLFFIFVGGKVSHSSFLQWVPFWTAHNPFDWVFLWWGIWGIFLPLAVYALFRGWSEKSLTNDPLTQVMLGFLITFLVANFILFQPMHWDNSKLFFWCYLGLSFGVAALLEVFPKGIQACLIFILISTGAIEVLRVVDYRHSVFQMTGRQEIQLSEQIREAVHPREVFLTAPVHNHWISLWGTQPMFMGYSAWAMNYGFPYQEREAILKKLLGGALPLSEFEALANERGIRYVVISPFERNYLPTLNIGFFETNFKTAFQLKERGIEIFDLKERKSP